MRIFKYQDPDGEHTVTDACILETYFPWWKREMERLGRSSLINEETCIEDWVTVHWAWEVK
jgi:hypothetical protein